MELLRIDRVEKYYGKEGNLTKAVEFLDFYGIKEGDNMYLAPENRVAVW